MKAAPSRSMTADEFIAWAMQQPKGERYELVDGEIVGMSPERIGHARIKGLVYRALGDAIQQAGLPCDALPDGISVRIDEATVYEPDALVRCGEPLDDETVELSDPLIIVEVISPSSRAHDVGAKLVDYLRLPSVRHYLIVNTARRRRSVIHHRKDESGEIATRIVTGGELRLDPPGLTLQVEALFG